jgi:formate/nitrite transporter FocA (FNT family)
VELTGLASFPHVLVGFTLPVLLGNLVGGGALVGALHHAQIEADKSMT